MRSRFGVGFSQLSQEDLAKFRTWFAEFDAADWDRQFEADVAEGRLDALAEKALKDLRKGGSRKKAISQSI